MNIFRLAADMLHLLSFIVMLYRMKTQRSCRGVSLKSQILFLTVFCCRYLVSTHAGAGRRRPAGRRSGARSSERQAAQARGAPSDESIGPGAADRISKRVGQRRWPVSARPALLPPAHPLQFVRAALTSSSLRSSRRWLHGWRTERRPWWTNGLVGGARVAAPGALIARVKLVYSSPSRSMLSRWPPLLARCSTGRSHPTHPRDEKA